MTKKSLNVKLNSYDDIFSTEESRERAENEQIRKIPLSELHPFKDHPFKVVDDEDMRKMVESIAESGVLVPAIARPLASGGYELISGHRRCRASELAGLDTIPVIIRELSDDEATILMVDSNLQREEVMPSEKAFAYKMKMEALKHQGKRSDITSSQVGTRLRADEVIAKETGESRNQIQRYIRLTELLPELLDMVDNKRISFNTAVELSYLSDDEQAELLKAVESRNTVPSISQAKRIKNYSRENMCSYDVICTVLDEEKKAGKDKFTLKEERIKKFFPESYSAQQMEDVIVKLLDHWSKKRSRELER